jgi:hypothetical protein
MILLLAALLLAQIVPTQPLFVPKPPAPVLAPPVLPKSDPPPAAPAPTPAPAPAPATTVSTPPGNMVCVAAPCVWQAKAGKPLQCRPLLPNIPLCPPGYTFDNAEWNVPDKNLIFVWGACCPARPTIKK